MVNENKELLFKKAEEFVSSLSILGVNCKIDELSLRDYSIKLIANNYPSGRIIIDYSKKNNSFSFRFEKMFDLELNEQIERAWILKSHTEDNSDKKSNDIIRIYVDGSFKDGTASYAFIILNDTEEIYSDSKAIEINRDNERVRQVAGEIKAVEEALKWCKDKSINQIQVYYDYEGLKSWITGEWKAKIPITRSYKSLISTIGINIEWVKVASHTGDYYNEKVDKMARNALSPKNQISNNATFESSSSDFIEILKKHNYEIVDVSYPKSQTPSCKIKCINDSFVSVCIWLYSKGNGSTKISLHEIKDASIKKEIDELWNAYKNTSPKSSNLVENRYSKIEYYYSILKKYETKSFDFSIFATELAKIYPAHSEEIMKSKYCFHELEAFYKRCI